MTHNALISLCEFQGGIGNGESPFRIGEFQGGIGNGESPGTIYETMVYLQMGCPLDVASSNCIHPVVCMG